MNAETYWAWNSRNKTVAVMHGFDSFEHLRTCFRVGIQMPDGNMANGIGRSPSLEDLHRRANKSGYAIIPLPLLPQPVPSFANRACIECGEWSASGGTSCEDCAEESVWD